ncbi:MAG: trigger factor [Thiomargarita sp.]|nr:trigger factor [Thiomargarita sp.]
MQVSVETIGTLERRMTVKVSKEHIKPKIQSRFKSMAQKTKLNGFRPGKVPVRVIEQKYGQQIRQEILREILQSSFSDAVSQENLIPVGDPVFDMQGELKNFDKEDLSYIVTFEVYPDVLELTLDNLSIEKPTVEITADDIDIMLERLRYQRQTWITTDQIANKGDRVTINFVGTIDGSPFKDNKVTEYPFVLGNNDFIPGFEENLTEIKVNDQREFDLNFSTDYHRQEMAGKTVHFVVNISEVSNPKLPELNEEFIKSFGVEDGNIETLRTETCQNMERELKYVSEVKVKQQILQALLKANPMEVPQSLIKNESEQLLKIRQRDHQNPNLTADLLENEAKERVQFGFLINKIVKEHKIDVDPEQVQQMITRIAYAYNDPQAIIKSYNEDKQRLASIESIVLENQVVHWLLDKAQVTEKQVGFYELTEQSPVAKV